MANEVKLQEGQPVDDNLRPLKVGGESTSIELAKNGARINGDLELRGDAGGDTTAINCKKVIISENYSDTTAATITPLKIKFDKEGATTSNNTINIIDINANNTTPTDGNNSMTGVNVDATLTHAADAGVAIVYGGLFSATGSLNGALAANEARAIHAAADGSDKCYGVKAVSTGTGTNYGVHITCSSSGATNKGLYINSYDGGADFTNQSSASANDYFTLNTIADGETTLTTVESGGGSTAHLNMVADGNFTVDAAGDISLDAGGGDVTILQADVTIPVDKKVIFGNTGEYIVGDDSDLDIVSSGRVTNTCASTYKIDSGAGIILDSATGAYQMHGAGTTSEFSVTNSAYAGMILGYTTVGIDAADDNKTLGTSFATTDAAHNVSFIAPPSGVVEISVSIYGDLNRRAVFLGLSDNATYNAVDVTHEHSVSLPGSSNDILIRHSWVVTGLTAGDTYKWWLGAKCSHVLSATLRWGGDATGEYAPFIMKATALPAAITDFAVYG